jgi:glycosyltransferase involved in cell wall biosynthesis
MRLQSGRAGKAMKLSVIISTYNSPDWLEKVLWGYACQSAGGFEIVIADDGSTQSTADLIKTFKNEDKFSLKHVRHDDKGFRKWEIVNKAIIAASGDYLLFTDGDCIPHDRLVETHLALAQKGRFLSGGYCKLPMATSKAIDEVAIRNGDVFKLSWLRKHGYGLNAKWLKFMGLGSPLGMWLDRFSPAARTFNGNNSSCFRSDALAINGFDKRILYGGGDREFGYRLAHSGVLPKVIRYRTLCLHLDHARGYKSIEVRQANMALIEETRLKKRTTTSFGIRSLKKSGDQSQRTRK